MADRDLELMRQARDAIVASGLSGTKTKQARVAAAAALTDRLAEPVQPVAQWQPIESAPDGVMLLGCDMKADELRKSFYVFWLADGKVYGLNPLKKPTHWMALPAAPNDAARKEPTNG